ncbi:hypothetical protein BJ912DRAFT_986806 [Pholiota molesta]|nr:hypothetical protein BJ912DRAFT_986806 [Pholiota molesta]
MEQEHIEVEERTLGDDPEDNKLGREATDIDDQEDIQIVVQDFDEVFGDEEQDTAYEPELEDIQEETGDDEMEDPREGAVLDISAKDVASRDLLVVADLFANMKSTLALMSSAFDRLGSQTEKMASISLDVKAAEQLKRIKSTLEAQITRHRAEVEALRHTLQAKVKAALEARIRDHLHDVIKGSVQDIIEEKVRQELSSQIPEDLCQQVISHKRQILEVKASLHNSEARRYNALQTFPTVNARLRPLLRPLPTPEQSPVPISISRSSSMGHSTLATPTNAFFQRTGSNSLRPTVADTVPPSPSPFFPRDMTTLFALNPEETKRLLREYGLSSAVASPAVEHPVRPRGLSIVNEDAAEEEDQDVHARDLNTFMAHIGVRLSVLCYS